MGIADYILIGGVILFALIGLIRGGAKMFFGLFLLVIIMVAASFLSGWLCPLILKKDADGTVEYTRAATILMDPIGEKLPLGDSVFDEPIVKGEDGVYYVADQPLSDACAKIPFVGSVLYPVLEPILVPGQSVRTIFAYKITEYIYEFVLWLVLVIVLVIVRNIFRKKVYRFLDNHSLSSKIDRLIGAIVSVAIFLVIFWGVGTVFTRLSGDNGGWADKALSVVTEGVIAEPVQNANPFLLILK